MRMVESGGAKCFPAGWNVAAKLCDSCKNVPALLFCRKDSMFLCMACDVKMHAHTRHERVWMCEACEHAPASVTCKADAAALCVTCDRDIHTANPLARRHDRIPVVPFYDCVVKSNAGTFLDHSSGAGSNELNSSVTDEVNITWGIPTDTTSIDVKFPPADMKSIEMLFSDSDHLLEFDFPVPTDPRIHSQFHNSLNDSVVPVQSMAPAKHFPSAEIAEHHSPETRYEIDFTRSSIHSYNKNGYASQSLSHSVSSSSMDVGVVPEGNSMSEISYPFMLPVNGGVELNGAITENRPPTQLSGKDREARVLRYREKKKNRKFEKTIRYASRKAYAETRPRIKGRFAKRTESTDLNVDRWFFPAASNCFGEEAEYGVVPSF